MKTIEEIYNELYKKASTLIQSRSYIIQNQNTLFSVYYFYDTHSCFQKEKESINTLIKKSQQSLNTTIKELKELMIKIDKLPKYYRNKLIKLIYD